MYKIMLVDDEKLELEMIRDYVNWEQYDIEVVGTAKNGMEALTVAEVCLPDIIITDVKMPIMDGLQFSKELRKRNNKVEIIFLSGYDEFAYIKTALQLEVTDYLLKPLDFEELPSVISRAKERIEKRKKEEESQKVLLEQFMKDLLFNPSLLRKEADITRKRLVNNDQYFLVIASIDNFTLHPTALLMSHHFYHFINDYISKQIKSGIVIETRDGEYGIILNLGVDKHLNMDQALRDLMEEFFRVFQISLTIVLPSNPTDLEEISNVYTISKNTLQLRFYYGPGKLLKPEMINKKKDIQIPTIHQDLATSMLVGDWLKSEESLNLLFNYFIEHEVDRDIICNELYKLLTYLLTNLFNGGHTQPFEKDALKNIFQFDTLTDLKHFIQQKIKSLFQYLREKEGDNYQQIVNQIILYIKDNLNKSLIVEDIASNVYLSPNYIRSIFKEKTGETILSFITNARIEKATELLQNKSLKIKDICISVGFESVSYFCSLFRKYKGMTPNEFRKKIS